MSGKDYPTLEENIRFIISDVGVQTILREIGTEEVVQNIDQEALLKALVEQAGRENIQQLLQKLSGGNDKNNDR